MNEIIERVAQAIRTGRNCGTATEPLTVPCPFCSWGPDDLTPSFEETGCVWLARAAIAAMREPSKAMLSTGWQHTAHPCWEADVADTWRAMIDAALAD
jgi:hypothetical protein